MREELKDPPSEEELIEAVIKLKIGRLLENMESCRRW